jgi:hypothetical protein
MGLITTDHIQRIIDNIDCSIKFYNVEVLGGGKYKLFTRCSKWATFGKLLNGWKITEVKQDEYIIVWASVTPIIGYYSLVKPYYYFGTFLDTNSELVKVKQAVEKLPMIYLHLNAPESYKSEMETVDFITDCAIYFLSDCDPKNWLTGDHFTNVIKPMKSLVRAFVTALYEYSYTNASNEITYIENDYVNFGNVQNMKGVVEKIFADNLSGTELLINIGFNKSTICCN